MIRKAEERDVPAVLELLRQVLKVHNAGRPDLFAAEGGKYSREELLAIFADPTTPVFVFEETGGEPGLREPVVREAKGEPGVEEEKSEDCGGEEAKGEPGRDESAGTVKGYVFCRIEEHGARPEAPHRTLYIDDLCVDEKCRGQHIGRALYGKAVDFARENGCYNLTLHVWECNRPARAFYDSLGLEPQYTALERIL